MCLLMLKQNLFTYFVLLYVQDSYLFIFYISTCSLNTRKGLFVMETVYMPQKCAYFWLCNVCISFSGNTQRVLYVIMCCLKETLVSQMFHCLSRLIPFIPCVCTFAYLPWLRIFTANTSSSSHPCCSVECSWREHISTGIHGAFQNVHKSWKPGCEKCGVNTCWLKPSSRLWSHCDWKSM